MRRLRYLGALLAAAGIAAVGVLIILNPGAPLW